MRMSRYVLTALAAAIGWSSAAGATTTHWSYIVPGTCSISSQGTTTAGVTQWDTGAISANNWGQTNDQFVSCTIALPQGASITKARIWGDDPRAGGYAFQFLISKLNYINPQSPVASYSGHSSYGTQTYWYNQYSESPLVIDNENNGYMFQIWVSGGYASVLRLIEITYTMP
jgi:hypothetical protein